MDTFYLGVCQICFGIFWVKIQGRKGAYEADKSERSTPSPRDSEHGASFVMKYI